MVLYTLTVSKLWGLEVGDGVKTYSEIKVYESWMRLLLLMSEAERFSDTACRM